MSEEKKSPRKAIIVGISGSSSSGKTTLSRLLRDIFPGSFILHEDDFYKPDDQIPLTPTGVQDWDCAEALEIPSLLSALQHIHTYGEAPPSLISKEDQNPAPTSSTLPPSTSSTISQLKTTVIAHHHHHQPPPTIAILDGFLLYGPSVHQVREMLDVKLFLRTPFEEAKRRREARAGYVTLDGFWTDPPGYMDEVVWPAYVREHAFLFERGDVQGGYDWEVVRGLGVSVAPDGVEGDVGRLLEWAVGVVLEALEGAGT